jgi:hypothetical protein
VLLHSNAYPLTAVHTIEVLKKLDFEILKHLLYSPYFAPLGYHLFGPLEEALRGD